MNNALNVLGTPLQSCGQQPLTGYYRDGRCRTDEQDRGRHVVCAIMDDRFLEYSRQQGNDLISPVPESGFPGLRAGDQWCVCALRWKEAQLDGYAPKVVLAATHQKTLELIELDTLLFHAIDIPRNA